MTTTTEAITGQVFDAAWNGYSAARGTFGMKLRAALEAAAPLIAAAERDRLRASADRLARLLPATRPGVTEPLEVVTLRDLDVLLRGES